MRSYQVADETVVLADSTEVPGLGHLPVNAFLLRGAEPLLVDTGLPTSRAEFLDHLWSLCDPEDLRWVWLTHPDRDHTGSLLQILEAAPQARLITTFLGLGILSIEHAIPPERAFLLNPGQSLDIGDRVLRAFRPPLYDSPATAGLIDQRTGACFSSDCFGAPDGHVRAGAGRRRRRGKSVGSGRGPAAVGDGGQSLGRGRRSWQVRGFGA